MRRHLAQLACFLAVVLAPVWAHAAPVQLDVRAEHQQLRTVLVHEPGRGLGRVTRSNAKAMLFEHPVDDWAKARDEHIGFQELLKQRGVEVVRVHDLLKETLDKPETRVALVDKTLKSLPLLDAKRRLELGKILVSLPSRELATLLTEGLTQPEIGKLSHSSAWRSAPELILPAHANLMFTRDTTKVVGNALTTSDMATALRNLESELLGFVVDHHERFAGEKRLTDHAHSGFAAIEGGDMLVVDKDTLLVGVGERTHSKAVQAYAKELFGRDQVKRVVMTALPNKGSMFHTDTIMNRVSEDHFLIHPVVRKLGQPVVMTPDGRGGVRQERSTHDLLDTLAHVTGKVGGFKTIGPRDERIANLEQELDGSNVLPINNGVVVAYGHNTANNAALEKAGIEVLQFAGEQLVRGRGGPHCLTRPLR